MVKVHACFDTLIRHEVVIMDTTAPLRKAVNEIAKYAEISP